MARFPRRPGAHAIAAAASACDAHSPASGGMAGLFQRPAKPAACEHGRPWRHVPGRPSAAD
eukprot:611230-Pleurochrysis_carterae.AAC.1